MIKIFLCASLLCAASLFGEWGTPFQVYDDFSAYSPVSGIDNTGNGVVAYYWQHFQDSGAGATQIVNGAPVNPVGYVPLEGPVQSVNIALNGAGNATMVWSEYSGTFDAEFIRSVSLLNNVWSDPSLESALFNSLPGITKDNSNNSIGLWNLSVNAGNDYTVAYDLFQSGAWAGENQLFVPTTDYIPISYLAGSPSGQGFAIWSDSGPYILQGAYYNGSSWVTNLSISTDLLQNCQPAMNVTMNSSNQALMALAKQSDGGIGAILFSGGNYGSMETVYVPQGNFVTQEISVALNNAGEGAAAWISQDATAIQWNLYIAFRLNNGWQTPLLIDTTAVSDVNASLSKVNSGLDNAGNAYVVWQKTDSSSNSAIEGCNVIKGAVTPPGYVLISTDNTINATNPSLAVNGSGQTLVSWQSGPNESPIIEAAVGSFFVTPSQPSPPLNLAATQVKNKFISQVERVNILTWIASIDTSVQNYNIFRNDVLIGNVKASSSLKYVDHNQKKKRTSYKVTAANAQNIQSTPVTVIVP